MVLPSGEKATDQMVLLCALCFSSFSSSDAAASTEAVRSGVKGWRVSVPTPASQTLSVPDAPPETIVLPSGSNCTDMIASGSAFSTLESSFRFSALDGGQEYQGGYQVEEFRRLRYLHPRL